MKHEKLEMENGQPSEPAGRCWITAGDRISVFHVHQSSEMQDNSGKDGYGSSDIFDHWNNEYGDSEILKC